VDSRDKPGHDDGVTVIASDEAIQLLSSASWIALRSLSSGAHSRDPLARMTEKTYPTP
jgi:hypothetical protein